MLKITKSNAHPDQSVPEEPPFSALRTPYKLIGVQIDSTKSLIRLTSSPDSGRLCSKCTGIICVYISAQIDSTPYSRR